MPPLRLHIAVGFEVDAETARTRLLNYRSTSSSDDASQKGRYPHSQSVRFVCRGNEVTW
jgi:hypothetical protein